MSEIKRKFGDKPEYDFDLVFDATSFSHTNNPAGHIGHHVLIMENILQKEELKPWLDECLCIYYSRVHKDKPVVRVLVLCPKGTKRSVACAEILKYVVEAKGMVCENDIEHLSKYSELDTVITDVLETPMSLSTKLYVRGF